MAPATTPQEALYTEDSIRSLDWREHIRLRPGMYIGKLGDGSAADDGIYVLVKEIIDNSIDEFVMGNGRTIEIKITDHRVVVRDYGRGIPLGKVIDCVSKINTGGKYDSKAFQKSVGLNGVGTKAVNALSTHFLVQSVRDGQMKVAEFVAGELSADNADGTDGFRCGSRQHCQDFTQFARRRGSQLGVARHVRRFFQQIRQPVRWHNLIGKMFNGFAVDGFGVSQFTSGFEYLG